MRRMLWGALIAASAFGQAFEVASVKPGPPPRPDNRIAVLVRGGPGTDDPTRAILSNLSLANLITLAFRIDFNHLSAPDWTQTERFIIEAKVPAGATKEEFGMMLRNLLIERFHLATHPEKKEVTTYDLVVAKGGPKFRGTAPEATKPEAAPPTPGREGPPQLDQEGFPILPSGRGARFVGNRARVHQDETMDQLASMLSGQLRSPVTDATGLTGKYDVDLRWVTTGLRPDAGGDDPGPSIFDALQSQLGLRLQAKKGMIDVLVVDHIDKTPTEN